MKRILISMIIVVFLINSIAALDMLPPAELNKVYTIRQTCASCTYVRMTLATNQEIILHNVSMEDNGAGTWVYNYTPLESGRYDVTGVGDLDGDDTSFATYFQTTGSGFIGTLGFYILLITISFGIIILGYYAKDAVIVLLGAFGLIFVGLYFLFNGIDLIKDPVYTWGISLIIIGLACYLGVRASQEFF